MPGIQIEYYDPRLTTSDSDRNYELIWMGDYPTGSLIVQLQQPIDAQQVITVPAATSSVQGSDGLVYHTIEFGPQPAGLPTSVNISYVKDTDTLSGERFIVQPSTPISENTSGRVTIVDVLPWGLGIVGILLLGGGLWWYWQAGREQPKTRRTKRGQRSRGRHPKPRFQSGSQRESSPSVSADTGVYCHQCGKRAETGDRFCRSCGSKLREI
jgi:hypothetical protein